MKSDVIIQALLSKVSYQRSSNDMVNYPLLSIYIASACPEQKTPKPMYSVLLYLIRSLDQNLDPDAANQMHCLIPAGLQIRLASRDAEVKRCQTSLC